MKIQRIADHSIRAQQSHFIGHTNIGFSIHHGHNGTSTANDHISKRDRAAGFDITNAMMIDNFYNFCRFNIINRLFDFIMIHQNEFFLFTFQQMISCHRTHQMILEKNGIVRMTCLQHFAFYLFDKFRLTKRNNFLFWGHDERNRNRSINHLDDFHDIVWCLYQSSTLLFGNFNNIIRRTIILRTHNNSTTTNDTFKHIIFMIIQYHDGPFQISFIQAFIRNAHIATSC